MTKTISTIILLCISYLLCGQEVKFEASVDAKKIIQNSTVNIEFTIYNANEKNFRAPNFKDFQVVVGPNQSTQMSIVNGSRTQKKSYGYSLLAKKVGKFSIGSATAMINGKNVKTNPITIEVVKGNPNNAQSNPDEDLFVVAKMSDSTAIIGQQIIVDYTLYTRVQVDNFDLLNEPDYDGFFSLELNGRRDRAQREIIDGKEYYTQSLKKVALFPQQTGTYEYEPVIVNLWLNDGKRRSIFNVRRRGKQVQRTTRPIKIQVVSNPPNAPLSYSGAVGSYAMNAEVDKKSITTDDAIKITMIIKGSGDAKIVTAPKQDFGPSLEVYEPNILREEQMVEQGYVSSQKIFEYLIVPKKTGRFNLQPKFSFYNPDSSRYETLTVGPFVVNVAQGMKAINTMETLKSEKELSPLIANASFVSKPSMYFGSSIHWLLLGLICFMIPVLFLYKLKLRKEANIDPRIVQMKNAEKVANTKLSVAKKHLDSGSTKEFYDELQNAIFGYLSDRLEVPYSQMNKNDIKEILENKEVPQDLIDHVTSILQKAEKALFAGANSVDVQESYDDTKDLILGLEKHFKE